MKTIYTGKETIGEIFDKRWYRIPEYQRPYVWGKEEVNLLLEDIYEAMNDDINAEYFLGSIIFQNIDNLLVDMLDGQQRLTTLFLLIAVIRDLTNNPQLKDACQDYIFQVGNEFKNIPEKVRIEFNIRDEVKNFVEKFIKVSGKLKDINSLKEILKYTKDISVKNMVNNIFEIKNFFRSRSIEDFSKYLFNKVVLIYVSSSSLEDAFKLFTVMNDRGIKLRNSDILKAMNLREINSNERDLYAKKWEEVENYFGEDFDKFLSYLRMILVKEKAKKSLLSEFEENIYFNKGTKKDNVPLLKLGKETVDFINKYKNHYENLFDNNEDVKFNALISIMKNTLPADLWIAPLLRFYDKFQSNNILEFLEKLDNKFSFDWIVGFTPTKRIENTNKIIKAIENINDVETLLKNDVFNIDLNNLKNVLNDDIYGKRFAKYLLYKLEYFYVDNESPLPLFPKTLTIEHILPQNPPQNSQWRKDFSDEEIKELVHKIGNLILMSRRKNSSQGNRDFIYKKNKYFKGRIDLFRHSTEVILNNEKWTSIEIKNNQDKIVEKLMTHYSKNNTHD